MAPPPTLPMIAEIATAVKTAIQEAITTALSKYEKSIDEEEEDESDDAIIDQPVFDIREQILANVRAVWPFIDAKRPHPGLPRPHAARPPSLLQVVITREYTSVRAVVVYPNPSSTALVMFATSADSVTHGQALRDLLDTTAVMAHDFTAAKFEFEKGGKWCAVGERGWYYA